MSESKGLRLKPPTPLPQGPVSKVAFKVFVNQLTAYLEQDYTNYLFLPGGCYEEWGPQQEGRRIRNLANEDPENQKLVQRAAAGRDNEFDLVAEQNRLLLSRNSQLSKFITLIAILCHYTEQDDVTQCSTSMAWITNYLRQHYNLESRGEHFLDIVDVAYNQDMPYQTFYKQFRAGFLDNLRKQGDRLVYKNNTQLEEDEKMSPTLEATIVLWALERIDIRLPKKVKKNYGHQMVGHNCLVSLQPTIFQNIGNMLNELDEAEIANTARMDATSSQCNLLSSQYGGRQSAYRPRSRKPSNRGGSSSNRQRASGRKFCRICYHAGAASSVYLSNTISTCSYLTKADKADLRALDAPDLDEQENCLSRHQIYSAPGWDQETDSESGSDSNAKNLAVMSINDNSYSKSSLSPPCLAQSNALMPVNLNRILPVPSQILQTQIGGGIIPITLDSGATLSFIRLDIVNQLGLPVSPNNQFATLADQHTQISAVGEIDVTVMFHDIPLRLRALVVTNLQAPCFGGTTFHVDNKICTDLADQTISVNQKKFKQSNTSIQYMPTIKPAINYSLTETPPKTYTAQVEKRQSILPGSTLAIPLKNCSVETSVAVTPSFQGVDSDRWPSQVCTVSGEHALYRNSQASVITCPRYSHFSINSMGDTLPGDDTSRQVAFVKEPPSSIDGLLKKIQINKKLLNSEQLATLEQVHRENAAVFNNDLTTGYNHRMGEYSVSFVFKSTSSPPPFKVWAPQYNRGCQELLQAKCDQLESQGVLVDPLKEKVDVLHLSPIMIQQKGSAKFKKLQDCSLDEIRFISCQNVLNDSIKPIPSTSTSHIKIMKFLARWKYHIFADLHSSYFQIPIDRRLWGYMAVNTPFKGMKILTRTGQGLLNSDVHLDQLMCKVKYLEMNLLKALLRWPGTISKWEVIQLVNS